MRTAVTPVSRRLRPASVSSCTLELDADVLEIARADARARHQSVKTTRARWIREQAEMDEVPNLTTLRSVASR